MSVKAFFPKVPDNEDEFMKFINRHCEGKPRFVKNKDGNKICILTVNFDENINCVNDLIEKVYGTQLDDITLKPKIHVDSQIMRMLQAISFPTSVGEDETVSTTHIEGKYYYVQLLSENDDKISLYFYLKNLYKNYVAGQVQHVSYDSVTVDTIYGATYENDGTFHRIKIISKLPDKTLKGFYLDFGNTDEVHSSKVVEISQDMQNVRPLAHKCTIDGIEIIDSDKHMAVAQELVTRRASARVIKEYDDTLKAERVVYIDFPDFSSISYREYLVGRGIAKIMTNSTSKVIINNTIETDEIYRRAMITNYESLTEFYVLLDDSETDDKLRNINGIIGKLQTDIENAPGYQDDKCMYLGKYSVDNNWYRCVILQNCESNYEKDLNVPHSSGVLLQFIDFGNCEWKRDTSELKLISNDWSSLATELGSLDPCAIRCTFEDELVYNLQCAGIGKIYFQEKFVSTGQVVKLFCIPKENNELLVSNIIFENGSDLLAEYEKPSDYGNNNERYCLTAIDSLKEIWFSLFKSYSRVVQKNIEDIRRACKDPSLYPENIQNPNMDDLYLICHDNLDRRMRARYIGSDRRNLKLYFRDIDTGCIEVVRHDQVYKMPLYIADIDPFAKPYKLKLRLKVSEHEVIRYIKKTIGKMEVSLRLQNDDITIVDVITKGRSLTKSLFRMGYIERDIKLPDLLEESVNDVLDGLKMEQSESLDVNFDLPSIEHISNVPSEIKLKNARLMVMRMLFTKNNQESHLNGFAKFRTSTQDSQTLIEIVNQVEIDKNTHDELKDEFKDTCLSSNIKRKDLDGLLERRDKLCNKIIASHKSFEEKMKNFGTEPLNNEILDNLQIFMENIASVYDIQPLTETLLEPKTIDTLIEDIARFLDSEDYAKVCESTTELMDATDNSITDLQSLFNTMFKKYKSNEDITHLSDSVALIDKMYETNSTLTKELDNFLTVKENPELLDIIRNALNFLNHYLVDVEKVKVAFEALEDLVVVCKQYIEEDKEIKEKIEQNNKALLGAKKELRWAKVNLEDAEDSDDPDTIEEAKMRLSKAMLQLHEGLRNSANLIDTETKLKMINKYELQVLNQSIILHQDEIPLFIWDISYFENIKVVLNTDQSVLYTSEFDNEQIRIQQVTYPEYSLSTYLSKLHRVHVAASDDELCVKVLPVNYSFLSRADLKHHFIMYPDFQIFSEIPENIELNLCRLLCICRDLLTLITNLWHHGYIYAESDFIDGLFIQLESQLDLDELDTLYLPLPMQAIVLDETVKDNQPHLSISTILSKFHRFVSMKSARCVHILQKTDVNPKVINLIDQIPKCQDIDNVETLTTEFDNSVLDIKQRLKEELDNAKKIAKVAVLDVAKQAVTDTIKEIAEEIFNEAVIDKDVIEKEPKEPVDIPHADEKINGCSSDTNVEQKDESEVEQNSENDKSDCVKCIPVEGNGDTIQETTTGDAEISNE